MYWSILSHLKLRLQSGEKYYVGIALVTCIVPIFLQASLYWREGGEGGGGLNNDYTVGIIITSRQTPQY